MSTEIICSGIALMGVVVSSAFSCVISKFSTKIELEKLQKTWEREDATSYDEEFSEMVESVARAIYTPYPDFTDSMGKIAAFRSKEHGSLALALDELYSVAATLDKTIVNNALTKVIEEKRKISSHS